MKKLSFPTAHSVLLIIAALVALATWLLPAGKFEELKYDNEKKIFVHVKSDAEIEYPAEQRILDSFAIKISLSKFEDGSIWKPVGIPGTYHNIEAKPQGVIEFIKIPTTGSHRFY
jgi:uncharacterized ion transporter superfamily protein YfcC